VGAAPAAAIERCAAPSRRLGPRFDRPRRSWQPIAEHAFGRIPGDDAAAAKNLELSALHHRDRALSHPGEQRSPGLAAGDTRDIARANRESRLTAAQQSSSGRLDAAAGGRGSRRQPPRVAAFSERDLGFVDPAAAVAEVARVAGITHRAARRHQFIHQLLAQGGGDVGIGRSPPPASDDDERVVRGCDVRGSHGETDLMVGRPLTIVNAQGAPSRRWGTCGGGSTVVQRRGVVPAGRARTRVETAVGAMTSY
jgi:hypothetical protein